MLKMERLTINNKEFIKHYSDENYYILQKDTGIKYAEAVDKYPTKHEYEETDEKIDAAEVETPDAPVEE